MNYFNLEQEIQREWQGWTTLALKVQCSAEFSSNPDQTDQTHLYVISVNLKWTWLWLDFSGVFDYALLCQICHFAHTWLVQVWFAIAYPENLLQSKFNSYHKLPRQ